MPAGERHDVTADPLTPYWRAKVEAAAAGLPMPTAGHVIVNPIPQGIEPTQADLLFAKLWNAGAPYWSIAVHLKLGHMSRCAPWSQRLRFQGWSLFPRGMGWKPPADWQQRVDRIIESGG